MSSFRVLILNLACLILVGCQRSPTTAPVLIGHLAPFSGPDKVIGEYARQAMQLAIEDVNKEGNRILGRRLAVLHPSYSSDEAAQLPPIAIRLITVDKIVALIGGTDLDQARSLGRATQPYDAPFVTPAELSPELLGNNVFSVNAGLSFEGQVLARFAGKELNIDRSLVTITDGQRIANVALTDAFIKEFSKGNAAHVSELKYQATLEPAKLVEVMHRTKAQGLLFAGAIAELGRLRAKMNEAGIKLPILFGGGSLQVPMLLSDAEISSGVFVAAPFVPGAGTPGSQEFVKVYQDRFHEAPDVPAALAYDSLRVLIEAMRRAQSFQPAKLVEELAAKDRPAFDSLSGPLTFDKSHAARRPIFVAQVENGQLRHPRQVAPDDK